jgi:hypothetical protein
MQQIEVEQTSAQITNIFDNFPDAVILLGDKQPEEKNEINRDSQREF